MKWCRAQFRDATKIEASAAFNSRGIGFADTPASFLLQARAGAWRPHASSRARSAHVGIADGHHLHSVVRPVAEAFLP